MSRRRLGALARRVALLALAAALSFSAHAQERKRPAPSASAAGDFYIVSSVDLAKRELLLKRPTEVTEVIRVDERTQYFERSGKAIKLSDLRAGDTVYITAAPHDPAATALAQTIRKGPMTVEELHRRYLA